MLLFCVSVSACLSAAVVANKDLYYVVEGHHSPLT